MNNHEELLRSKEYWLVKIQTELYGEIKAYMDKTGMNQTELATHLGVSKGYISQILNGDFNHRISKLIELSLAVGIVPSIEFQNIEEYIQKRINKDEDTYNQADEIFKPIKDLYQVFTISQKTDCLPLKPTVIKTNAGEKITINQSNIQLNIV